MKYPSSSSSSPWVVRCDSGRRAPCRCRFTREHMGSPLRDVLDLLPFGVILSIRYNTLEYDSYSSSVGVGRTCCCYLNARAAQQTIDMHDTQHTAVSVSCGNRATPTHACSGLVYASYTSYCVNKKQTPAFYRTYRCGHDIMLDDDSVSYGHGGSNPWVVLETDTAQQQTWSKRVACWLPMLLQDISAPSRFAPCCTE